MDVVFDHEPKVFLLMISRLFMAKFLPYFTVHGHSNQFQRKNDTVHAQLRHHNAKKLKKKKLNSIQ